MTSGSIIGGDATVVGGDATVVGGDAMLTERVSGDWFPDPSNAIATDAHSIAAAITSKAPARVSSGDAGIVYTPTPLVRKSVLKLSPNTKLCSGNFVPARFWSRWLNINSTCPIRSH